MRQRAHPESGGSRIRGRSLDARARSRRWRMRCGSITNRTGWRRSSGSTRCCTRRRREGPVKDDAVRSRLEVNAFGCPFVHLLMVIHTPSPTQSRFAVGPTGETANDTLEETAPGNPSGCDLRRCRSLGDQWPSRERVASGVDGGRSADGADARGSRSRPTHLEQAATASFRPTSDLEGHRPNHRRPLRSGSLTTARRESGSGHLPALIAGTPLSPLSLSAGAA
jgi:hypothetical protein